jgi:hypothetical protein
MINVNFIPDDYIQNNESKRTNLICIGLLAIIILAIAGAFGAIKMRQHTLDSRESALDADMIKKKEQIKTVEQIQKRRNAMWATAVTTVDLIEPFPKSILLALLTNNLPKDVSFLRIGLIQKEQAAAAQAKPAADKFQAMQDKEKTAAEQKVSKEKLLASYIEIEGIAPSDIEVASYIEKLSGSFLLKNVALIESVQMPKPEAKKEVTDEKVRRFKLSAMINREAAITEDQVIQIAYLGTSQTQLKD